jgi:hypothetical protein
MRSLQEKMFLNLGLTFWDQLKQKLSQAPFKVEISMKEACQKMNLDVDGFFANQAVIFKWGKHHGWRDEDLSLLFSVGWMMGAFYGYQQTVAVQKAAPENLTT